MKKISLFALALSTGMALFAQDQPRLTTPMTSAVRFGIKGGVNLANFRAHDFPSGTNVNTNTKTSFNGGFLVNIPLAERFAFQPEVLYTGQGSKLTVKTTVPATSTTYEQDLSYIAVPLMFQAKAPGGFFVEVGPQPAFLVRAQYETNNQKTDNKSSFDKFDLGLNGGIGYLSRIGLGVNARYTLGLTNTLEDNGGNNSSNDGPEFKNQVIQFSLFWQFGAGK
ncbi:MAG TPA: porin family protein [Flavisolibacter sp.]|jgi:hypothetical protein|nr:porin family protein [Flavisolibacter sp.]